MLSRTLFSVCLALFLAFSSLSAQTAGTKPPATTPSTKQGTTVDANAAVRDSASLALERAARLEAAKRFAVDNPMRARLEIIVNNVADGSALEGEDREDFVTYMRMVLRHDLLEEMYINGLARFFTAAELDALRAFYATEAGRGVIEKYPLYSTELLTAIDEEIRSAIAKRAVPQ